MSKACKNQCFHKNTLRRVFAAFLAVCLVSACFNLTFADIKERDLRQKVVIGYPILKSVHEIDEQGYHMGYNYEYLQEIARYSNWDYEFVIDTWENCIQGMRDGTIDMMGFLSQTTEREEFLNYAKMSAGTVSTFLVADKGEKELAYMDMESMKDSTVGVLKGSKLVAGLETFCAENDIAVRKKSFDSETDMLFALEKNEIDMALISNFETSEEMKIIAEFDSHPFYFAVSKASAKAKLIEESLNDAMGQIFLLEPDYNRTLFNVYVSGEIQKKSNFTEKEKEFIKNSGPIKVTYDPSWKPLIYTEERTGQPKGAIIYLFDRIEELSGLKFEYIKTADYNQALEMVKNGDAQIVSHIIKDFSWAERFDIRLTTPVISMPVDTVTNEQAKTDLVAVPKNYLPYTKARQLEQMYPVSYFNTTEECYEALKEGRAKTTYANVYVNNYLMEKRQYRGLNSLPSTDTITHLCMGINNREPQELISVMNKAILSISSEETNQIAMRAGFEAEDKSLGNWIYANPNTAIGLLAVIFSLILLGMLIYIGERRKREKVMQYNPVTGIWNFSRFIKEADRALKNCQPGSRYVMTHIDICKFRFLNDTHGFEVGNKVLRTVGEHLIKFMPRDALFGSLWADHFVCMMKCIDEEELNKKTRVFAAGLNREIHKYCDFRLTIKVGAYFITEEDLKNGLGANHVLQYANYAMGTLNDSYKNSVACFDQRIRETVDTFKFVNRDMITAFYNKQFVPYYQPKFNIYSNEIIGAEALVRWIHPEKGIMQPSEFLPYFEKSGFIVEVDLYIFEETCKNIRRWLDQGKKEITISCNFSSIHAQNQGFVKKVVDIVKMYDIPFDLLELELTETVAFEEVAAITEQISQLHEAGFYVSIDDFGSGYSSLSVLQQLKVDTIKLDRTFIKNGTPSERECRVVEAIVNLAEQLNMKVICEGVETIEQVELLKNTKCAMAQGFYFARPMPVEELEKLLPMKDGSKLEGGK